MDILQAITYPYKKENWKSTLLIPTLGYIVFYIIELVFNFTIWIPLLHQSNSTSLGPNFNSLMPTMVPFFLICLILSSPLVGYNWTLVGHWQENGLDAPAPEWKGHIKEYFVAGLHFFITYIIFYIPFVISIFTLGLFTPFVIGPLVLGAKERTIGSVFANIGTGCKRAANRYLAILGTLYLTIILALVAIIPGIILILTLIGPFILMIGLSISFHHLITQAFMTDDEKQGAASAQVSPSMPSPPNYWNK